MRDLRQKTAFVSGAASGIGRAIALKLAREKVDLYLVDINEPELESVATLCRESGVTVIAAQCDLTKPHEITRMLDDINYRWGGVDIVVNNAGITYYGRTHEMSSAHWDQILAVNLKAHIDVTRGLLDRLLERPEAHVVNICSILGLVGMPKVNAYCVSKFGLLGFSEALRAEYGREGLGVSAICPGFVDTNLFSAAPRQEGASHAKTPPKWVQTTPDLVAQAVIKAIRRNRRLVVVEPFAKGLFAMKRFAPWILDFASHLGRRRRIERKREAWINRPEPAATLPLPERSEPQAQTRKAA